MSAWALVPALALVTTVLHGGAVFGGWKFDDGPQLLFAASHSPWQYFTVPEVMRQQSYAHITPWNALFFDIGLPWFGPRSPGHYVHLLAVLWLASVVTWALLKRWLSPGMAWGAALLFLAFPSTGAIARMLMTGHYAYGLLFSVLALLAFARAAASRSMAWAVVAALFYGLACLCKELYVPLVMVVLVWPGLALRLRAWLLAPMGVMALAYSALRLTVLHGVGGYAPLMGDSAALQTQASRLLAGFHEMQQALFGLGWPGLLAGLLSGVVIAVAWWRGRRPSLLLLGMSIAVLLAPVLPLLLFPFPYGLHRVMFFLGWAVAVLVAWQLDALPRYRVPVLLMLAALLAIGQHKQIEAIEAPQRVLAAQNDFIVHAAADSTLVAAGFAAMGPLLAMREAAQRITGRPGPALVGSEDEFLALGPEAGAAAWAWSPPCACIQPLGPRYEQQAAEIRQRWAAGESLALKVHVELAGAGRVKTFRWRIDGAPQGVELEVRNELRLNLAPRGTLAFGLDTTFRPTDPLALRFIVRTPAQAVAHTPWLLLSLSQPAALDWSGTGTSPPTSITPAPPPESAPRRP